MGGNYSSPAAFKQALKARIKRRSGQRGMNFNRLRQIVLFERFAARVYEACGDAALLKGGLVMELRLQRARTTRDVDFRLEGTLDDHLGAIREAARSERPDRLSFEVSDPRDMTEHLGEQIVYEAVRLNVRAKIGASPFGAPFHMDISMGDRLVTGAEEATGTDIFEFMTLDPVTHRVYPREAHIAEKLHAWSLPRDRENSRTKDLVDIGLLAAELEFEMAPLRESIDATFDFRGTHEVPASLPAIPDSWARQYQKMQDSGDDLPWDDVADLETHVDNFLTPVLSQDPVDRWIPEAGGWE